jgi:GNAT superfamily N-acetyltransferase
MRITTWYLEMTDPAALAPAPAALDGFEVRQAEIPSPALSRFLYTAVGAQWSWTDRLGWDDARWAQWLAGGVETWLGWLRGTPAGYAQLEPQGEDVEIAYFGLLPEFIGRGLGPRLLDAAARRAWALGPKRVWVHTCSLDSPAALATYERRGFTLYDERTHEAP